MSIPAIDPTLRRLREAEGFLELGLPGRALEIIESRPHWATVQFEASYLSGEALRELGRHREALAELQKAADLRPGDVHVALAQGWCFKRTHRLAQAIDVLERALRTHPEAAMLRYNLACYLSLAGDAERCLKELRIALRLEPKLRPLIPIEADFEPVRGLPGFARIASGEAPGD